MAYRVIRPLRSHRRGGPATPTSSSRQSPQKWRAEAAQLLVGCFSQQGHPWGLRTGPIQEGSQPGPRLDRKARAGKDPKAHSRYMRNQACRQSTELGKTMRLKASKRTHPGTGGSTSTTCAGTACRECYASVAAAAATQFTRFASAADPPAEVTCQVLRRFIVKTCSF